MRRGSGMEVSLIKPTSLDDAKEICDYLLAGKAVVLNMEGILSLIHIYPPRIHRHADRTERGWKIHDLKEHHPGTFPIRRKCIS